MKLLVAILLISSTALCLAQDNSTTDAAIAAPSIEAAAADPQAGNAICSQLPTCETPKGTDGWTNCRWLDNSAPYVRQCTAICNSPFFGASPSDPFTRCSPNGGWIDPVGQCIPTDMNCLFTTPPRNTVNNVNTWQCQEIDDDDYARSCTGTCKTGTTFPPGSQPTAHCSKYTGKWEVTGGCAAQSCTSIPPDTPPTGTIGWNSDNCFADGAGGYTCQALCRSGFMPNPTEPETTCNVATGQWSAISGACTRTSGGCGTMPPASVPNPANSLGWTQNQCVATNTQLICAATCQSGFSGSPTVRCDLTTGRWGSTAGQCTPGTPTQCSAVPPSSIRNPANSFGWTQNQCVMTNSQVVCTATCQPGFSGSPSVRCDLSTGRWGSTAGQCTPGGTQCGTMPPTSIPDPSNSFGWSQNQCVATNTQLICSASCLPGFGGSPTVRCDLSTGRWGSTTGQCTPGTPTPCGSMPPASVRNPANSFGWSENLCRATNTELVCAAQCLPGFNGNPIVRCSLNSGTWGSVSGSCTQGGQNSCGTIPNRPSPSESQGWSEDNCYEFNGNYVCASPCQDGFQPSPSLPVATCSGNGVWTVTGGCQEVSTECGIIPPDDAPPNTIGWDPAYCDEVNGNYVCNAYCAPGYVPSKGTPSATCNLQTGQWGNIVGGCEPGGGTPGGCTGLPNWPSPSGSYGWSKTNCYTTGYGQATTICIARCKYGYNEDEPSSTCDWKTGRWSPVVGQCNGGGGGGDCSNGYPDVPPPRWSKGWKCYSMGYGPYAKRVCTSACQYGYYGLPCPPTIECLGGGSWSSIQGACAPYRKPSKPCWGYPGGYPTCFGGKGKWRPVCGGSGYSYHSRTFSKGCYGKKTCYSYSPSYVKHGTLCKATCTVGGSGYWESTCENGIWKPIIKKGGYCGKW